ncbi:ARF small monomeric GTPase [Cunninghamella echinulata]|nr:ARF small monomeric GTPase [Cunninghamella echinulata]
MDLIKSLPYVKNLSYFKKKYKALIYGLDASGKTSILYKIKTSQFLKTVPTIGFNVETIEYKNNSITIWDISARVESVHLRHYTPNTNAIIIIVDSTDNDERLMWLKSTIIKYLDTAFYDYTNELVILFYFNKSDLPNSRTNQELCEKLELNNIIPYTFHCQSCSALVGGSGLNEGLDWLIYNLRQKN